MTEGNLLKKFSLYYTKLGGRIFRMNSGMAWTGKLIGPMKQPTTMNLSKGDVVLKRARPFHGAIKGTPDLQGWTNITITEDMVGKSLAIFTALEVKTPRIKATDAQKNYIRTVIKANGIAGVIREQGDIDALLTEYKKGQLNEFGF